MAGYGSVVGERCRFCGLDLPPDAVAVMTHINTHWRQFNLESLSLSPCAFEPQLDIRVGTTPINPEDLEVSTHMEQQQAGFHYTYSPQTEPSNLTINGARCSPLNLTGRPRSCSPMSNSVPPPPPTATSSIHQQQQQQQQQASVIGPLTLPLSQCHHHHHHHNTFPLGMLGPTQGQTPLIQTHPLHQNMEMATQVLPHDEHNVSLKRKRRLEADMDTRCRFCGRVFYTRASFDEHMNDHMKQNNTYIMNEHMDSGNTQVTNVMPCTIPDKPYKCAMCDREFLYKEELIEHTESHEAAKPYKCDLCGAGLSHISALRRHRKLKLFVYVSKS
ncbi:hypothetical protein Pmani_020046 [Petrolisthes manimaculis]|uniref:C2H2-type domain-containing protein n=1 Tax=Petrolisthes manimaculis TaxID=1843537 RepID=A0AAE1U2Z1_9EUCA|nr:hypothetical protein Pmani_020046 [Petrolisthes manimaculis]